MKQALVTGANRGISFAIAVRLVDEGYDVLLGASDAQAGEKAAQQIGAKAFQLDLACPGSIALQNQSPPETCF